MRRALVLGSLVLVALAIAAWRTEPPRLLSIADWLYGGGRGVTRVAEAVPFGSTGQTLDVWRPDGDAAQKLPVIVFYYGGGWVHGDRGAYAFAARALAKAGYVVVVPDYRKVPGVRFPAFIQDGAMAVRWVRDNVARYGGDPDRVALSGHSAGAYIAAMLALDRRWLQAEGVDPRIVKAAFPMCGPYDFYPFTKRRSRDAMQGAKEPAMTQPIHFARADAPPMLLLTAGSDSQVGSHNARNLAARLKALGAPVEHIDYAELSHENVVMALSVPYRDLAPVLADSVAFLRQKMPGRSIN